MPIVPADRLIHITDVQDTADHSAGQPRQAKEQLQEVEAQHRASPSGVVVYKAIMSEADEELSRSTSALFWSGLAAGMTMGLSLAAEGILRHHLPDRPWTVLVSKLGYAVGFVIIILGRQQLFTENTLTPMLPLLKKKDFLTFLNVGRLWIVVLIANFLGALLFSLAAMHTEAFEGPVKQEFIALGREAIHRDFLPQFTSAIFAGWLIAMLVWMLPYAESAHFFVIFMVTWLIGVAKFSHVIAGSVDVFCISWAGVAGWWTVIARFIAPVLLGNIVGGITLVAALNHAQINAGESE